MTREDLHQLVAEVQRQQSELDSVEVKAANGGTPKSLQRPLSAFANSAGGGVLLFGLDEETGFSIVGVGNPHRLQEDLTNLASTDMEPALRPKFEMDEFDGKTVVAAEIEEVPAAQKPCFFRPAGLPKGAFLRVGNTNRQMTEYEIFGYLSAREQPTHDEETISKATVKDLDDQLLDDYLNKLRQTRPNARYLKGTKEEALTQLRILAQDGNTLRPTLSGLLTFGIYPQGFFPQLRITFVQFYGTTETEHTPKGERYLDNRSFEGPISDMINEAERHIYASMRKAALITGMRRQDIPEYPPEALREALANAIAHRDYSPYVRGSYIQVRMFADRMEIQSPGGLFGNVTIDNLDQEQSTRNTRLMRLMEDLHIVENRGNGIQAMLQAMRDANLEPPGFDDKRTSFWVTLHNHTLMDPDAIQWLNQFADYPLNDRQRVALVYLQQQTQLTNRDYRHLNHVDTIKAGEELRGLVQTGLVTQNGASRWTYYTLITESDDQTTNLETDEERILDYVQKNGSINNEQCRKLLSADTNRAYYLINKLIKNNYLIPKGNGRWRVYKSK
jgi:ATP-dependent DNA helicase RecG